MHTAIGLRVRLTLSEEPVAGSSGLGGGMRGPATMQSRLDEFVVKSKCKKQ